MEGLHLLHRQRLVARQHRLELRHSRRAPHFLVAEVAVADQLVGANRVVVEHAHIHPVRHGGNDDGQPQLLVEDGVEVRAPTDGDHLGLARRVAREVKAHVCIDALLDARVQHGQPLCTQHGGHQEVHLLLDGRRHEHHGLDALARVELLLGSVRLGVVHLGLVAGAQHHERQAEVALHPCVCGVPLVRQRHPLTVHLVVVLVVHRLHVVGE
mmetsp:Transcript_6579/g.20867  ORF Transcript_6579/g.20867 Transcript_6579/m.20867 type:complete len:212 (+) Transcript_6579:2732-3367(+)